jgi:RNA polymerase sigma factor (TIGR02999 family)
LSDAKPRETAILMPLVYDELRRIAAAYLSRERPGQTLQATALVNEAFVRLSAEKARHFNNRTHFRAIAAISMRQILIQRARARKRLKRGGAPERVTLDEGMLHSQPADVDIEALDEALKKLEAVDPHLAHLVELRYFGGLSIEETAEELGSSPATVKRHWALARAWLKRALE